MELETLILDPTREHQYKEKTKIRYPPHFRDLAQQERPYLPYFETFFPQDSLMQTIAATTASLQSGLNLRPLTKGEYYQWLGLQLKMALIPYCGGTASYWKKGVDVLGGEFYQDFGRFGMSLSRYRTIREHLCFAPKREMGISLDDVCTLFSPSAPS